MKRIPKELLGRDNKRTTGKGKGLARIQHDTEPPFGCPAALMGKGATARTTMGRTHAPGAAAQNTYAIMFRTAGRVRRWPGGIVAIDVSRGAIQKRMPLDSKAAHTASAAALSLDEWLMNTSCPMVLRQNLPDRRRRSQIPMEAWKLRSAGNQSFLVFRRAGRRVISPTAPQNNARACARQFEGIPQLRIR